MQRRPVSGGMENVNGIKSATPIVAERPGRAPTIIPEAVLTIIAKIFVMLSVPASEDAKCSSIVLSLHPTLKKESSGKRNIEKYYKNYVKKECEAGGEKEGKKKSGFSFVSSPEQRDNQYKKEGGKEKTRPFHRKKVDEQEKSK
jgi:hypothetical protein